MNGDWQPVRGRGLVLGCIAGLILWAVVVAVLVVVVL